MINIGSIFNKIILYIKELYHYNYNYRYLPRKLFLTEQLVLLRKKLKNFITEIIL